MTVSIIRTPELWTAISGGDDVAVVDVRSRMEYDDKHLPGAINVPWEGEEDIVALAAEHGLDPARRLVVYCSSPM